MTKSTNSAEDESLTRSASSDIVEVDEMEAKEFNAYKSDQDHSDECRKDHLPGHKQTCEKERAANNELHDDDILFQQPESSHLGECPICFLPQPNDQQKTSMMPCCCKIICKGCKYANMLREIKGSLGLKCLFCRQPTTPKTNEEVTQSLIKRAEAGDPIATCQVGLRRFKEGNFSSAFELWTRGAEMGDAESHHLLSYLYGEGKGVEQDEEKRIYHLERAAIGGHSKARHNVACIESELGREERAVKHWIIAAKQGDVESMDVLKECYGEGSISKEDFAAALRGHHAAVDATKSPQREEAKVYMQKLEQIKLARQMAERG